MDGKRIVASVEGATDRWQKVPQKIDLKFQKNYFKLETLREAVSKAPNANLMYDWGLLGWASKEALPSATEGRA